MYYIFCQARSTEFCNTFTVIIKELLKVRIVSRCFLGPFFNVVSLFCRIEFPLLLMPIEFQI